MKLNTRAKGFNICDNLTVKEKFTWNMWPLGGGQAQFYF